MKRFLVPLVLLFFCAGFAMIAEESVLIDFSKLTGDVQIGEREENEATIVDFSQRAGTGFGEEEKAAMKTSLMLDNWEVILASSSRTIFNQTNSKTISAPVNDDAKKYAGETVLGIRIYFPDEPFNSYAIIKPPFEIPAYMRQTTLQPDGTLIEDANDRLGSKFDGFGVLKNVGAIKSISINVYGSNFANGLGLILQDHENRVKTLFIDYLAFDGWKTLTWKNPNYIDEVRNREIIKYPLYPKTAPMYKILGIVIYKDGAQPGGDFITYVKDISMIYDKAVLSLERDIDEEALWGILEKREEARRTAEFNKLGNLQVLRYLEQKKMHSEESAGTE